MFFFRVSIKDWSPPVYRRRDQWLVAGEDVFPDFRRFQAASLKLFQSAESKFSLQENIFELL
jgi:hypothetical protein